MKRLKMEYQIKGRDDIVFGRFSRKEDRDSALKFVEYGIPCEEK